MSISNKNPSEEHWAALEQVLRYLSAIQHKSLTFRNWPTFSDAGYSDSDWGSCIESRKSTEGCVFIIGGGAVSWKSKKQTIVATSSCEAEYIAVCSGAKEAIWLSRLIAFISTRAVTPITIHIDNQGAIELARHGKINARNKHINFVIILFELL